MNINQWTISNILYDFALGIVPPWGRDSRSEAWFWEVSGKRKRSRLPPEYSPTQPTLRQAQGPWGWGTPKSSYKKQRNRIQWLLSLP